MVPYAYQRERESPLSHFFLSDKGRYNMPTVELPFGISIAGVHVGQLKTKKEKALTS